MLTIQSSKGPYPVAPVKTLHDLLQQIQAKHQKSVCVLDENIIKHYPDFHKALTQFTLVYPLKATEQNKDPHGLLNLLGFMQQHGLKRKSDLLVIGGGITQDLASLAAQLYFRGIGYTLVPTTLLGMADSCIGSKSSLNFNGYKNQLGGFYPPSQIYICTDFINSLTKQEIYSGLGEILKIFIIANRLGEIDFSDIATAQGVDKKRLEHYIFEALSIKKQFIEKDEFDLGDRRILNYGHTFGHALELETNYTVPHGLAVVLGIDIINYISHRFGVLAESSFLKIHNIIKNFYPWQQFSIQLSVDGLINAIRKDKKLEENKINLVLLSDTSGTVLQSMSIDSNLAGWLESYPSPAALIAPSSS